jgi:hypothetical protein
MVSGDVCRDGSRGRFAGDYFVNVTPDPFFSGLDRANQGMAGVMKMLGGMLFFDESQQPTFPQIMHIRR